MFNTCLKKSHNQSDYKNKMKGNSPESKSKQEEKDWSSRFTLQNKRKGK